MLNGWRNVLHTWCIIQPLKKGNIFIWKDIDEPKGCYTERNEPGMEWGTPYGLSHMECKIVDLTYLDSKLWSPKTLWSWWSWWLGGYWSQGTKLVTDKEKVEKMHWLSSMLVVINGNIRNPWKMPAVFPPQKKELCKKIHVLTGWM